MLLEYGADITIPNNRKKLATDLCVSDEFQQAIASKTMKINEIFIVHSFLSGVRNFIASIIPAIMRGDADIIDQVISDHTENRYKLR